MYFFAHDCTHFIDVWKSTKLSQGCVMVKMLQPDLPICLQYQDEFVCCRRSSLQNRHIFGNDLLFPGFGSSLTLALTCKSLADCCTSTMCGSINKSMFQAESNKRSAICALQRPFQSTKVSNLEEFLTNYRSLPLLESWKSGDWFSTQSFKVQF